MGTPTTFPYYIDHHLQDPIQSSKIPIIIDGFHASMSYLVISSISTTLCYIHIFIDNIKLSTVKISMH